MKASESSSLFAPEALSLPEGVLKAALESIRKTEPGQFARDNLGPTVKTSEGTAEERNTLSELRAKSNRRFTGSTVRDIRLAKKLLTWKAHAKSMFYVAGNC